MVGAAIHFMTIEYSTQASVFLKLSLYGAKCYCFNVILEHLNYFKSFILFAISLF